jgi:superfamily I DNA/RNA helicase
MADEFQDTCHMQFKLLRQVVERHHNLAVVRRSSSGLL